jgi:hypothetical protein
LAAALIAGPAKLCFAQAGGGGGAAGAGGGTGGAAGGAGAAGSMGAGSTESGSVAMGNTGAVGGTRTGTRSNPARGGSARTGQTTSGRASSTTERASTPASASRRYARFTTDVPVRAPAGLLCDVSFGYPAAGQALKFRSTVSVGGSYSSIQRLRLRVALCSRCPLACSSFRCFADLESLPRLLFTLAWRIRLRVISGPLDPPLVCQFLARVSYSAASSSIAPVVASSLTSRATRL